jgi:8-oxo-dGTP pyrophosphatase MutT (NUDIX family)
MMFRERALANLSAFERRALPDDGRRRAAVAILVSPHGGVDTYVLTRRSSTLRYNAGNWALPGGGIDDGEDAAEAALRETHEELGVRLPSGAVLGLLDDFETLGGRLVTPVVLWSAHELTFAPNPAEVAQVFRHPLAQLESEDSPRFVPQSGGPPILQMRAGDSFINAPTAAWLYQFREVAMRGRATRLDNVGQPDWTAR